MFKFLDAFCRRYIYIAYRIVSFNSDEIDGLVLSHLPDGPTAHFKMSSVRLRKEIKVSLFYCTQSSDFYHVNKSYI